MRRINQCVSYEASNTTFEEQIRTYKKAGYDGVFLQWYDMPFEFDQFKQAELCKELGLNIEFIHLGYQNVEHLWKDDEIGEQLTERYIRNLHECAKYGIKMAMMHLTGERPLMPQPIVPNEIGLKRLQKLVKVAEELDIKLAFENCKIKGFLEYAMDNIDSPNAGICFDSGHCHCHFKDDFDFKRFKNRIFCVHLHDNSGLWDEHILPFDGTINWKKFIKGLRDANYQGAITLESCHWYIYESMDLLEYAKESISRAKRIIKMLDKGK